MLTEGFQWIRDGFGFRDRHRLAMQRALDLAGIVGCGLKLAVEGALFGGQLLKIADSGVRLGGRQQLALGVVRSAHQAHSRQRFGDFFEIRLGRFIGTSIRVFSGTFQRRLNGCQALALDAADRIAHER